jgi:ribosomal protein S12 methylthiotransferase accessory factor
MNINTLISGLDTISNEIGILFHIIKLPRMNLDPNIISYGVWAANTEFLNGEKFGGRSAGCGYEWEDAILGTVGETVERYAPAFYDIKESLHTSYKNLNKFAMNPKEFALFHEEQYKDDRFRINRFTETIEVTWFPCTDLTNGRETWLPAQFIYLPFSRDKNYITANTSTGLAAHTNYFKAILSGLYETIERDGFVLTWTQNLVPPKIVLSKEIKDYIQERFPSNYDWHFFDISYDIGVPTVLGFCIGEAEFGKFIAVGSSTRVTFGQALEKTILEIGQAIPYFRHLLGEKKDWNPTDDYTLINGFEEHSIFYTKRQDLWHLFDKWIDAVENKNINLYEEVGKSDEEIIRDIVEKLKAKDYNVLFKDLTTPDIRQLGFYSIKVFIPQLIQLAGSYPFYFLGGKRLYTVPEKMGYKSNDYNNLNKYPHPFP